MRPNNIWLFIFLFVCAASTQMPGAHSQAEEPGFVPMFNGKNLDGWRIINTHESTWKWDGDLLVCSGKPIGELRTERMYQNFILEVEWRHMVPKGNAGIFVWADDITARGVPFHRGIEVQVLENAYGNNQSHTTHGDIFPIHGATMKPENGRGGGRAFPTEWRANSSPEWNHYRIECNQGSISLAVNGKVVTRGSECNPSKGYICLESEGGIVHFRNIRIKELPDTPVDDDHVAIAERGYQSLYNGIDLEGWNSSGLTADAWKVNDWVLAYRNPDKGATHPLSTKDSFEDFGFVVDFRLPDEEASWTLDLRGVEVPFGLKNEASASLLESKGRWNRVEGTVVGDQLTMTVNGKPFAPKNPGKPSMSGSVTLIPNSDMDFANIYARQIKDEAKE